MQNTYSQLTECNPIDSILPRRLFCKPNYFSGVYAYYTTICLERLHRDYCQQKTLT